MRVTFPHMGNAHIAIKSLLQGLKLEVAAPPPITARTLELGIKYSPEFACLPLKINMGNFIEAMELGADTIIMAGGWGPCRFGYYAQVEREILKGLGYEFNMIILEAPEFKMTEVLDQIRGIGDKVTWWEAIKTVRLAWNKLNLIDRLEQDFEYYLPRVIDKNKAEKIYHQALRRLDQQDNRAELEQTTKQADAEWKKLAWHQEPVLRIGLVGEIYTILEPGTNCDVIKRLGRLNVEISRAIYTSDWVNDHLLKGWVKKSNRNHIIQCAQPYLNYWVGGHGQETVGATVSLARRHYDGVIQIAPLTCMPEIVAQSILNRVEIEENIHCMSLYFDEQSGTAGVQTRLEAFVDMLRRQRVRRVESIRL